MFEFNSFDFFAEFLSNRDVTESTLITSEIPQSCKEQPCMLGIDEAGRGPTLGPMVYGITFCPVEKSDILRKLGCADSKELNEEKRNTVFSNINLKEESKLCLGWMVDIISPSTICSGMYRRTKYSLNEISMDSAINLIKHVSNAGVNINEIYVDTVGPPEKYQAKLSALFPAYKIVVAKKADSTYSIVSAASICAKVTRDYSLKSWRYPEKTEIKYSNYGSGYPGDPETKSFISKNIDNVFGYPNIVRFSWSTAENAMIHQTFEIEFADSGENVLNLKDSITKFFKGKNNSSVNRFNRTFFNRCNLMNAVEY